VVKRIFAFKKEFPHYTMHSIRAATVNSWILGYLCMNHSIAEERDNVIVSGSKKVVERTSVNRYIWQFMRHSQPQDAHRASITRHQQMHNNIRHALNSDTAYPWALLSLYDPAKIFSDLIESILGAIYIDSGANHDICDAFLERLGLFEILDRILTDEIACMHPKELLGIAARERSVQYVWGEEGKFFTCQVKVGGRDVGGISKGLTRETTSCQAALEATNILKAEEKQVVVGNEDDDGGGVALNGEDEEGGGVLLNSKGADGRLAEGFLVPDADGDIQMGQDN